MVHPVKGETISSYKKLKNDPAAAETWMTTFGKEFGGMAEGDNKTGQKGTNSIFVMNHIEIALILQATVLSRTLGLLWTTSHKRSTPTVLEW